MSTANKRQRGLSLIEAIVSVTLVAIAVVSVIGAMGQITRSEDRAAITELMHRLASEKYDEIVGTGTYNTPGLSGDFQDRNIPGYTWRAEVTPTTVTNLNSLQVTVEKNSGSSANQVAISGLIYTPATTGTGSGTGTGTGTGVQP